MTMTQQIPRRLPFPALHLLLAVLLAAAVLARPVLLKPPAFPVSDSLRYVNSGLGLLDYGVISSASALDGPPAPGFVVGGPLIAVELALVMGADPATKAAYRCALRNPEATAQCPTPGPALQIAHWLELTGFASFAWLAGWLLFGRRDAAWVTLILVLACRQLTDQVTQAMTEPLSYLLFGPFFVAWLMAWRNARQDWPEPGRWRAAWWTVAGLTLGLVILAKPAAMAVLPTGIALLLLGVLCRRIDTRTALLAVAGLAAGTLLSLLPWLARSLILTGHMALSDPRYLGETFAHRVAYNAMSWQEWLAGWINYLPDFGDTLARAMLPEHLYHRLGWDPDSYYIYGRDVLHRQAADAAGAEGVPGYLVRTYVLAAPLKHLAVTLLLAWRGMFVGRIWALVAFLLLPAALAMAPTPQRRLLLLMLVPAVVVLGGQALLSVSILRYNGMLVLPLALTTAGLVVAGFQGLHRRRRRGRSDLS